MQRNRFILVLLLFFSGQLFADASRGTYRALAPLVLSCEFDESHCNDANECQDCHKTTWDEWSRSSHGRSWSNEIFQLGFDREPKRFCAHCHAPLNRDFGVLVRERADAPSQGINCQVCHVHNSAILTSNKVDTDHPTEQSDFLRSSEFCASCHEFNLVAEHRGTLTPTDFPMQRTYSEWKSYREKGGEHSCQQCHMPDGSHAFPGGYSEDMLGRALKFEMNQNELVIRNIGAGHNIPTGDVFRQIVVEESNSPTDDFVVLYVLGKAFGSRFDETIGSFTKTLERDTTLAPFSSIVIKISKPYVRVVYRMAGFRHADLRFRRTLFSHQRK